MNVHILNPPEPEHLKELKSLLTEKIIITTGEIQAEHISASVLVAGRPTDSDIQLFKDLKVLIVPWTGIPPETLAMVKRFPGLNLHNLHHNAAPVAEMALTLLLTAAKRVISFDADLRKGNWEKRYQKPEVQLMAGKRALIVGYGEIGRRIDSILKSLDIMVKIIHRTPQAGSGAAFSSPEKLTDLLPETDFLILALPLTVETESLIGERELALLPDPAILINISRGKIVDQKALYQALKVRPLLSAGLDVWYNYPSDHESRFNTMPGDYPFHELENLVLSPHRAGLVQEIESLRMRALADLLNKSVRGEQMPNAVQLDLGY